MYTGVHRFLTPELLVNPPSSGTLAFSLRLTPFLPASDSSALHTGSSASPSLAHFLYDTSLSIQTRPLLPLRFRSTRVHATQASVCWRAQSTVDSLFFIDVPTNPGPRSFHAWALRRYHWPTPQPIVQLLKPYSNLGPPIFRPPKVHEPAPNISRSRISKTQRVHL